MVKLEYLLSIKFKNPKGIAEAFLIGEDLIKGHSSALILGDNLFYGNELIEKLKQNNENNNKGATVFAYPVSNPEDYAVAEIGFNGEILITEEKPKKPRSKYVTTGLYFTWFSNWKTKIILSNRGELEITDIQKDYLESGELKVEQLGWGMAWLDTGTCESLNEASSFVRTIENRQGLKIGCPEEVAYRMGFISKSQLETLAYPLLKSGYGKYLMSLLNEDSSDFIALQKNIRN